MIDVGHAVIARCAECGEPLSASGGCLACLLRAGLDEDDDGLASSIGDAVFGDFEIERREDGSLWELGRGAVGVTYRATDTVLHRTVALKVIEPVAATDASAMRERFLREARAAAALRHPNIATVFQFGTVADGERCYCAMELVEGETLEAHVRRHGPITSGVAFDIGMQVARALIAAAERNLVHRDLKPGNIMLERGETGRAEARPSGGTRFRASMSKEDREVKVKVIDFGLAKAISSVEQMELTQGSFVGTPAFASPEQFAGEAVDARSDIYALGVTLWFALTGRLPSAGTTVDEIRRRQAAHKLPVEQLEARGVPGPLITLLRSCLEPEPADRPASARELLHALEESRAQARRRRRARQAVALAAAAVVLIAALGAVAVTRPQPSLPRSAVETAPGRPIEKGVAVLPFENLSSDSEDTFFATGIQDDVLTSLAKIKDLKVIARSSVAEYAGARGAGKIREIGRAVGVSHVLEGSVRRAGNQIVVHVALVDTSDETQVWAERYERSVSNALSIERELAVEIARALRATLTPLEANIADTTPTQNPDAYLLFLRARDAELRVGDWERAAGFYAEALALDPLFALAHARLAFLAAELSHMHLDAGWASKARLHAEEALRLQPNLGEAHLAMTNYHLMVERDYDRALAELSVTTELLPNSAEVSLTAAFIYKLKNRYADRIAALRRAQRLDPRNGRVLATLARTLRWVRDWPAALYVLDQTIAAATQPMNEHRLRWTYANDRFRLTGNIDLLKNALAEEARATPALDPDCLAQSQYEIAMLERNYEEAARVLASSPVRTEEAVYPHLSAHSKSFHQALLLVARGDPSAQEALALAATELQAELPDAKGRTPIRPAAIHADLAIVYAMLGRKDEALQAAEHAIASESSIDGSIEKNNRKAALALVYAHSGEPDRALDLIEHLLTVPCELQSGYIYNMTLTDLKSRWVWDPLRDHPRFQKLLAGPEPKTVY